MKHQSLATSLLITTAFLLTACGGGGSNASNDQTGEASLSGSLSTSTGSIGVGGGSSDATGQTSLVGAAGNQTSGAGVGNATSNQTGGVNTGGASSEQTDPARDSDSSVAMGRLSLGVTDAPLDNLRNVVVQFIGVAFKRVGGDTEWVMPLNPTPQSIDLLQYRDGNTATLLANVPMPAGQYEWIRLMVNSEPNERDSYVVLDNGAECELRVPSGAQSGLKLIGGYTVPTDGTLALTVDFDLRKSIHAPPGQSGSGVNCTQGYLMRPTLRMVDNANVGAIGGRIDNSLMTATCKPAVYVYRNANVTPDDIEETSATTPDVDPYATTVVNVTPGALYQSYRLSFIPPGEYTVAFTCSGDDPTADEILTFVQPQSTTVEANRVSIVDFLGFVGS
jgi:hypothetical protein